MVIGLKIKQTKTKVKFFQTRSCDNATTVNELCSFEGKV